jgi:integrase
MAITYMKRRASGIYEFRRMLPRSLAGELVPAYALPALTELQNPKTGRFKLELTVSLRTSEPVAAKRLYAKEQARVSLLIETAQSILAAGPPPDRTREAPDFGKLEADMVAGILRVDEEERQSGDDRRNLQSPQDRAQWPDLVQVRPAGSMGMEPDHYEAKGEEIAELLSDYRRALAMQDARIVEPELNVWLRKNGKTTAPDVPWRPMAALAALRAHVKAYGLLEARQRGEDVPTPAAPLNPAVSAPVGQGPLLSDALKHWRDGNEARGARKPSPRSVEVTAYAVRLFTDLHGDLPLGAISFEKARQFRDAFAKMPTRLTAALKGKTLPELVAMPKAKDFQRPSSTTVNKLLGMLGAVLSAAEREGQLDHIAGYQNPFGKRVKLQVDERAEESRERFTAADIGQIFSSPIYRDNWRPAGGGGEAGYWFPLVALLSGARQNEIAQLRLQDLAEDPESGVWHFNIGTEGGRSIKTASSRRKVPVHPALIEIGILRYREAVAVDIRDGSGSLWPDVTADSAGRQAGKWSKWFNRYLRDRIGIDDGRKVFHSFRHSFKRFARDAKISEEMHDAITGHASSSVGSSYGQGFGLKVMLEALSTIPAPSEFQGLRWVAGKQVRKAPPKQAVTRPTIKYRIRPRRPRRTEG